MGSISQLLWFISHGFLFYFYTNLKQGVIAVINLKLTRVNVSVNKPTGVKMEEWQNEI